MALQSSGPISMANIRSELKLSGSIGLNSNAVRTLGGKSSGKISLADFYGKSNSTNVLTVGIDHNPNYRVIDSYGFFNGKGSISPSGTPYGSIIQMDEFYSAAYPNGQFILMTSGTAGNNKKLRITSGNVSIVVTGVVEFNSDVTFRYTSPVFGLKNKVGVTVPFTITAV